MRIDVIWKINRLQVMLICSDQLSVISYTVHPYILSIVIICAFLKDTANSLGEHAGSPLQPLNTLGLVGADHRESP